MFILNEDLFDELPDAVPEEPIVVDTQPEPTEQEQNNAVATMLIDAINGEWETIDLYNNIIINLDGTRDADIIAVIRDIVDEENVHVGQLQRALAMVSPQTDKIADGEQEAEEQLTEDRKLSLSFILDEDPGEDAITEARGRKPAGDTRDLWEKVYDELIGDVRSKFKHFSRRADERYDEQDIVIIDNILRVVMPTKEALGFAREVSEFYKVPTKEGFNEKGFYIDLIIPEDQING